MRPHKLELQAFGAFPGRVELDLDALGEHGLVLLCGDTGGGKTTLLDALGFALYGVVPGERHKARDDLRSHHAAPGDATWVRLELTARGRRLRITRTPEHVRPAKRGGGTTREQASALLERWSGGQWEPVAQRLDEVGHEVARVLGMDAAQFFQVVLLPQGRFAAFLQAKHDEREKLLKQLFHVRRFEHVERWLADRSAAAGTRLEAARGRLLTVAARLAQQADVEAPGDLEAVPGWAEDLAASAGQVRSVRAAAAATAAGAREAAEDALREALEQARRRDERAAAELRLAALREQAPQLQALEAELAAADRAVPVVVALAAAERCAAEHDARARAEDAAREALAALGGPHDALPDGLSSAAAAARTEAGRLEALGEVLDRAERAEGEAVQARADAAVLARHAEEREADVAALTAARGGAEERRAGARAAAAALPAALARLDAARTAEQRRLAAAAAAAEAQAATAVAVRTAAVADDLAEQARVVREQRFDAMKTELAALLADGDECPVCGSLDHPAPAEVRADAVTREQEQQAQRRADQARTAATRASAAAAAAAERAALLGAEQAPPADVPALTAEVQALTDQADDEGPADAELARIDAALQTARDDALTCRLTSQERSRAAAAAEEAAARDRARLAAELGAGADLADLLARTERRAAACEAAARAAEATATAAASAVGAGRTAVDLAQAAGFDDGEQAAAAAREHAWRAAARERLARHGEEVAAVLARLADPELAVAADAVVDVEGARAAAVAACAAHDDAVAALGLAVEREQRLVALVPEWDDAQAALAPLREEATELRGLAELAAGRGGNRLSMSLSTFVLAARLEEVAAAASVRLQRMTDGRYTLVHTDTSRDRRSRAGLGLQVEDSWTGRLRDTATLSGGETFMTALALALGLADVVTAEAGGHTIDALFVDEGFGSLDATTLDRVMDVLDELRTGGRLVGLVSHVADLRLRVPTQVLVEKGTGGSAVRTTLDAA